MAATHSRDYYRLSPQEAMRALNTKKTGLAASAVSKGATTQARPVQDTLSTNSMVTTYLKQYTTLPNILLAVASLATYAYGHHTASGIFLALIFLNTTLTWLQKAHPTQKTNLNTLLPSSAVVVREGDTTHIPIAELAVGDIVYLEKGMCVPADIRLLEEDKLFIDDHILTGDPRPKRKGTQAIRGHSPVTLRHNTALAGCTVTAGNAIGVAYAVGNHAEIAVSAHVKPAQRRRADSLERTMERIGKWAGLGALGLGAVVFLSAQAAGLATDNSLLYGIAVLAAFTPFSLPTVLHLILTRARTVLRHHKAVVASPTVVDHLGTINTILSDTTGVITKHNWKPDSLYVSGHLFICTKSGIASQSSEPLDKVTTQHINLLCTAALLANQSRAKSQHTMDGALATLASLAGIQLQHIDKLYREIRPFIFDTARQRTSSLRYYGDKKSQKPHVFTTGSPEHLLERCTKIWDKGKARTLTAEDSKDIQKQCRQFAKKALYPLGVAYRPMPTTTKGTHLTNDTAEKELVWLGVLTFANPVREHLTNALMAAQAAHVKVSLITDSTLAVAKAVALEAGLVKHAKELTIITSDSLARLSNTHVAHAIQKGNALFVHLSPHDKHRLASIASQSGRTVAITGRGLADAPALARADVGIGLAGTTTATPPPANFVLLDDNFATIIYSLKESRATRHNIATVLRLSITRMFALAGILATSIVAYIAFDIPPALTLLQIVVFVLAIELFPLASLGRDKTEGDPLQQHPQATYRTLFTRSTLISTVGVGLLIASLAYVNFVLFFGRYGIPAGNVPADTLLHTKATTLALLIVVLCQLANIIHTRSSNGIFSRHQLHNARFWASVVLAFATTLAFTYNPWLGDFFGMAPLAGIDWLYALATTSIFIAIRELQRFNKKHSRKAVLELHRTHRLKLKKI